MDRQSIYRLDHDADPFPMNWSLFGRVHRRADSMASRRLNSFVEADLLFSNLWTREQRD